MSQLLLSFYGDDFTGSADSMEALSLAGVKTALFLKPPSLVDLQNERYANLQAIGVAGISRSLTPARMNETLPEIFTAMKRLGAPLFHYKICSTFDSSPEMGSIGRAIDIGCEVFAPRVVPLLVGAPTLKRYCVFGHLFASAGNQTFRLDRHPTMSCHPVTPMRESDLRVHLSRQTNKRIELFDVLQLSGPSSEIEHNFEQLLSTVSQPPEIVLFDVLDDARLIEAGRLIWTRRMREMPFVVGSSGVEYALTAHWHREGEHLESDVARPMPEAVSQIIAISGSCSPVTKAQIEWAAQRGFTLIRVNSVKLADAEFAPEEIERCVEQGLKVLSLGQSVIVHTALGPDDERIGPTAECLQTQGVDARHACEVLGARSGIILRRLLERTNLRRIAVAGGDTAGHTIRQLGIEALEWLAPVAPGSPLCRSSSPDATTDNIEIALKGGQGGRENYFELVRKGKS